MESILLGLMLNGAGDVFKRLLKTVKVEHVKNEFGHWVKGRLGIDPLILHPSSTATMLFGDRAQMDGLCANIDAALGKLTLDKGVGPLLKAVEAVAVNHIHHK